MWGMKGGSIIQLIVSEDVQSAVSDNKVETCQNLGNMLAFDGIHIGYENVPEHMVSLINVPDTTSLMSTALKVGSTFNKGQSGALHLIY